MEKLTSVKEIKFVVPGRWLVLWGCVFHCQIGNLPYLFLVFYISVFHVRVLQYVKTTKKGFWCRGKVLAGKTMFPVCLTTYVSHCYTKNTLVLLCIQPFPEIHVTVTTFCIVFRTPALHCWKTSQIIKSFWTFQDQNYHCSAIVAISFSL